MTDEPLTRDEAFAELEARGAACARVWFSGGGDEGGVDSIHLEALGGKELARLESPNVPCHWNPQTNRYEALREMTLDERLYGALEKPVDDRYGSFAGEFQVRGTVVWDVATRTVKMDGSETYDHWESFEEDV